MSFVKSLFGKMSNVETKDEDLDDDEDDISEGTSTESSDTGFFASSGEIHPSPQVLDADCSTISNFFGYWTSKLPAVASRNLGNVVQLPTKAFMERLQM
ncbi:hypothetical protein QE152_g23439 [Popillia japonica]|uniref:Uncharacterized protein n=1 Tax=Popillia japonica TaxID=7064 RepID=A0AAW1KHI7_POPJA